MNADAMPELNPDSRLSKQCDQLKGQVPQQDRGDMSGDSGYIYLLINPSMEGLVKIGKTQREPDLRAQELSAATGVPTPFVVVYDAFFADCSKAEEHIHALLESQGYRINDSREFFSAPVKVAVQAIIDAQKHHPSDKVANATDSATADRFSVYHGPAGDFVKALGPGEKEDEGPPWQAVYEQAKAHRYGLGDTLEDKAEALRLFKLAAKMGSSGAFRELGQMIAAGEGCAEDAAGAIEWLKEGARMGRGECYAEMALIFSAMGHKENSLKCWTQYFKSDAFKSGGYLPTGSSRGDYGLKYCVALNHAGPPFVVLEQWFKIKDEILHTFEDHMRDMKDPKVARYIESNRLFALRILSPEKQPEISDESLVGSILKGHILWFDPQKGFGFIERPVGGEVFLHHSDIVEGSRVPQEGQPVEFGIIPGPKGPKAINVKVL